MFFPFFVRFAPAAHIMDTEGGLQMGGLAGYVSARGAPDSGWERLLQALPHGDGMVRSVFSEGGATLLHSGAARAENGRGGWPVSRRFGERTLTAAIDGALQNAGALREHLRRKGYAIHTRSDVELLLISYIEWGAAAPEHFSGDFAFWVWDGAQRKLFICGAGDKPLYFVFTEGVFAFAGDPAMLKI